MRHRVLGYTALGIATLITVGACSHSGAGKAVNGAAGAAQFRGEAAPAAAPEANAPAASHVRSSAGGSSAPQDDALSAKIRTAELTVAVRRADLVPAAATKALGITTAAGGEVDGDDRTSGPAATATMLLRVPPEALEATLDKLAALGREKSRSVSTVDVTEKVADVNSRALSARESIVRLRSLYGSATKVADVIAVEGELATREADLESLEAQQRTLDRQTSMAQITLTLQPAPKPSVVKPAHKHKDRGGFVGGLERGWDGFTAAAGWLANAVGTLLPFLVLLALVGLAGRAVWSRVPHRPAPRPSPTPAD